MSLFTVRVGLAIAISVALGIASAWADQPSSGHAGHDHSKHSHAGHSHGAHLTEADIEMPKDFVSAVARIKKCRATIGEEAAEQHWGELHEPVDEATIITNKLMVIARDSGVPKAKWEAINLAARELKKQFGAVHVTIEKTGKVDFAKYSKSIDTSIQQLEATAKTLSANSPRQEPVTR